MSAEGRRPGILQLGCGRWGGNILRDLVALGCDVTVVDPADEARANASAAGARRVLADRTKAEPHDGIVVATPTSTHAAVLLDLASGTTPIFVEKPLCDDPEAARAIASRARCPLFVMDKWRYHPAVRRLAEIARSGELGRVRGLRTTRVQWNQPHPDVDAVWILAPHDLSIAREILGVIPPLRSACVEGYRSPVEGVMATFGEDPWFVMDVSAIRTRFEREIRLCCDDGLAIMDDSHGDRISIIRQPHVEGPADPETQRLDGELPLLAELRAFVGYLAGGPPPLGTLEEAIESVDIIASLHRARR
jgi:predicted dehydrogenase